MDEIKEPWEIRPVNIGSDWPCKLTIERSYNKITGLTIDSKEEVPKIKIIEEDAMSDEKIWEIKVENGEITITLLSDAETAFNVIRMKRRGFEFKESL